MKHIYTVESEPEDTKPGCWQHLNCTVLKDGEKIGSYKRNYSSFFNTFFPFELNGKELALYSKDYTCTRIMSLPDCVDIGGEEPNFCGFCPTDYYIPAYIRYERSYASKDESVHTYISEVNGLYEKLNMDVEEDSNNKILVPLAYRNFGFVAGCVFGDDSSYKIQYLDLSSADVGIVKREEKFGYIVLPDSMSLKEAIVMDNFETDHPWFDIVTQIPYHLKTGKTGF